MEIGFSIDFLIWLSLREGSELYEISDEDAAASRQIIRERIREVETERTVKLVEKVRGGDAEAFAELYTAFEKPVLFGAEGKLHDHQAAEDVLQETAVRVWENISRLEEPAAFFGWVTKIADNLCIDYLRKKKPLLPGDIRDNEDEDAPGGLDFDKVMQKTTPSVTPDDVLDNEETRRMVREIVDTLPEDQRICMYMFYFDGASIRDMAERFGVGENTIKSKLAYGRKKVEVGVRAQEKKGIKLYSVPGWLIVKALLEGCNQMRVPSSVTKASLDAVASSAAKASATTASTAGAAAATTKAAGVGLGVKIAAGITALALVIGGVAIIKQSGGDSPSEGLFGGLFDSSRLSASEKEEIETDAIALVEQAVSYNAFGIDLINQESLINAMMPNMSAYIIECCSGGRELFHFDPDYNFSASDQAKIGAAYTRKTGSSSDNPQVYLLDYAEMTGVIHDLFGAISDTDFQRICNEMGTLLDDGSTFAVVDIFSWYGDMPRSWSKVMRAEASEDGSAVTVYVSQLDYYVSDTVGLNSFLNSWTGVGSYRAKCAVRNLAAAFLRSLETGDQDYRLSMESAPLTMVVEQGPSGEFDMYIEDAREGLSYDFLHNKLIGGMKDYAESQCTVFYLTRTDSGFTLDRIAVELETPKE